MTQGNLGLAGEEVTAAQAFVREGLIDGKAERFSAMGERSFANDRRGEGDGGYGRRVVEIRSGGSWA